MCFEAVRTANADGAPLACVLCDESQFFTAQQAEQLFMVTVDLNIPVICYGLRADFSLKGFPGSTRLLELAHTIEEMKTICTCGRKATCNCRRVKGSSSLRASRSPSIWKTMCSTSACAPSAISRQNGRFTPKKRERCFAGQISLVYKTVVSTTRHAFLFYPRPTGAVHAAAQNMLSLSMLLPPKKGEEAPISTLYADRCRMPASRD